MNAATKKTGKNQRAAFAIEEAIADTRSRIAASAGADLKQKAQAALSSGPRLQTERDGRIFAVDALERLKNADADKATAYPYLRDANDYGSSDEIKPYRKGPQWDGFYRDLSHLLTGTEEARKGFASIFTDCLAEDIGFDLDVYRELEAAWLFQDFGTPGTKYQVPKRNPKAKAKAAKGQKQAKEKTQRPTVESGQADAIEQFIGSTGPWRRAAMAFLERPYAEIAAAIKAEKKTAQAFAEVAAELGKWKENYMTLILRLTHAERDMRQAISARKDGAAILKWADELSAKIGKP
jgi:hypothetical protein